MRADRRVRREVAALEVDQYRLLPGPAAGAPEGRAARRARRGVAAVEVAQYRLLPGLLVGELEGRSRLHFGLPGDGFATFYLGDPATRALRRFPGSFDGTGGLASFACLIVATAASRNQRSAGGAHPPGRPERPE